MRKPIVEYMAPINPKDFGSYEEYKEALFVRDHFYNIVEEVEKVFDRSTTDDELRQGLEALGFITVDAR